MEVALPPPHPDCTGHFPVSTQSPQAGVGQSTLPGSADSPTHHSAASSAVFLPVAASAFSLKESRTKEH